LVARINGSEQDVWSSIPRIFTFRPSNGVTSMFFLNTTKNVGEFEQGLRIV